MPIYEHLCPTCEYKFDKLQSMSEPDAGCPRCGQPAQRAISLFAAVRVGDDGELGPMAGMGGCGPSGCGSCGCSMD